MSQERRSTTYDPTQVTCVIGGNIIEGYSEGEAITIEMDSPLWRLHKGQTSSVFVKNPHRGGKIMLQLLQSSPSNARLQKYLDKARAGTSPGAFDILIENNRGGEVCRATACVIEGEPQLIFGNTPQDRRWTILSGNMLFQAATDYPEVAAEDV